MKGREYGVEGKLRILKRVGLARSRYYDWTKRAERERLADLMPVARSRKGAILPEEKAAVVGFALRPPRDGYRRRRTTNGNERVD